MKPSRGRFARGRHRARLAALSRRGTFDQWLRSNVSLFVHAADMGLDDEY
jgi:hypothetical protein